MLQQGTNTEAALSLLVAMVVVVKVVVEVVVVLELEAVVMVALLTHIRPLIALALCSSSGFRGWTGVVGSGGERVVKPGYAPGSRV